MLYYFSGVRTRHNFLTKHSIAPVLIVN